MFKLRLKVWLNVPIPLFGLAVSTLTMFPSEPEVFGLDNPLPAGSVLLVRVRFDAGMEATPETNGDAATLTLQPAHPVA
jgi:hypothetical protein